MATRLSQIVARRSEDTAPCPSYFAVFFGVSVI